MNSFVKLVLTVLVLFFGVKFFNIQYLRNFNLTNTYMILLSVLPFLILFFKNKKYIFQKNISRIFLFCFITTVVCWISRGQTILESIPLYAEISTLGLYALFLFLDVDLSKMHIILLIMSILASIFYIIQFYIYPVPLCLAPESVNELLEDTTNSRFRMAGQSLISLGLVMGYVKYLQEKKYFYLLLTCLSFYALFLMGFRSMTLIAAVFIVGGLVLTFKFRFQNILLIFFLCILIYFFLQSDIFSSIFEHMKDRNETENFSNGSYIRVTQLQYWLTKHSQNVLEMIFGSGLPSESSDYGRYMQALSNKGINYYDFGIFSFIFVIGIFPVFFMVGYCIKAAMVKVPKEYKYLGVWLVFLLTISFLSTEFFRTGCMTIQAYVLAMITIANKKVQ